MLIFNRRRSFIFSIGFNFQIETASQPRKLSNTTEFIEKYTPMVVPAGIFELGSSLSSSGHSMTSLLGSLKE